MGSSPRVWGQARIPSDGKQSIRIIPTRVGTSLHTACCHCRSGDHPHACGDKRLETISEQDIGGSSPRVWGQVLIHMALSHADRIIPTRVGTRGVPLDSDYHYRDHPHACGDKGSSSDTSFFIVGSSPRVWGQARI